MFIFDTKRFNWKKEKKREAELNSQNTFLIQRGIMSVILDAMVFIVDLTLLSLL